LLRFAFRHKPALRPRQTPVKPVAVADADCATRVGRSARNRSSYPQSLEDNREHFTMSCATTRPRTRAGRARGLGYF
jgi:hypothetical protein